MRIAVVIAALLLGGESYAAGLPTVTGFVDVRAIAPGNEPDYLAGGLGKMRYGGGDGNAKAEITQAAVDLSMPITSELSAFVSARWDQDQRKTLDITEAFVRYRPVSTTPWRWSVRLGAFFPPISLENTDVGWTSPWTVTPSAINTWVGQELRTLGGEGTLEWRRNDGTISLQAAIYEWNDPTGVALAYHGWTLSDRPTALFDRVRLPDALAAFFHAPKPMSVNEFKEIDNRPGYYAGATWRGVNGIELRILRYDNLADPARRHGRGYAWETDFWSAGLKAPVGGFTLVAQGMTGLTEVDPIPSDSDVWGFNSAFVLLGRDWGAWRFAARAEYFDTTNPDHVAYPLGEHDFEHGHAYTFAASWEPWSHLRLTGEAMRVNSFRVQRAFIGEQPGQSDLQLQLNARIYY